MKKALEAREHLKNSPADVPFAEALIETRPRQIVEHLREAVRVDPMHFPAHSCLLTALLSTGDFVETRRQAEVMQGLFPRAALPDLARAMSDLIEGDEAAMSRHLDALAATLGPEKTAAMKTLRGYCKRLSDMLDRFDKVNLAENGMGLLDQLMLSGDLFGLRAETTVAVQPFVFPVPTVGMLFRSIETVVDAYIALRSQGQDAAFHFIKEQIAGNPEALFLAMAAANRLTRVWTTINNADLVESRKLITDIASFADQAATAPTLVPRSSIRHQSRILCEIADVTMVKITPKPDPVYLARIRDHLHDLITGGRRWPKDREQGLDLLFRMITAPVTRAQARDWAIDKPEGWLAFQKRREQLYGYGRSLVEDWLEEEPCSKLAADWKVKLEDSRKGDGLVP